MGTSRLGSLGALVFCLGTFARGRSTSEQRRADVRLRDPVDLKP